jgi:multiple antibiotic resistance protein
LRTTRILSAIIDRILRIPIIVDLGRHAGHVQNESEFIVAGTLMIAFMSVGEKILRFI